MLIKSTGQGILILSCQDGGAFVQPYAETRRSRVTSRRLTVTNYQSCRGHGGYKDTPVLVSLVATSSPVTWEAGFMHSMIK